VITAPHADFFWVLPMSLASSVPNGAAFTVVYIHGSFSTTSPPTSNLVPLAPTSLLNLESNQKPSPRFDLYLDPSTPVMEKARLGLASRHTDEGC